MTVPLHLGVNDVPSVKEIFGFGFQQAMLCMSGLLVYPFLISNCACAGIAAVQLRVQLISATFVSCGIATILQTTFGLRLSVLHGPAMAFLPPLLAYKTQNICPYTDHDNVPPEFWMGRMREIQGSLLLACLVFIFVGMTGIAGHLSNLIGPITIVPLMLLLTSSIVPTIEEKLSLHWISLVMLLVVVLMAVYLENTRIPVYYYSFKKKQIVSTRIRLFGQFPYLLSMLLVWFICFIMTITDLEPYNGAARTDNNVTMTILRESPWFQIPLPLPFGMPKIGAGIFFGYVASVFASIIENIGSYDLLARTSQQKPPPKDAINRAIAMEGVGSLIAAVSGVSSGVTTYAENIALIHITKVASRTTMQFAGLILILLGLFSKFAAILASIPDALVGGILTMGISMIGGVALSNLQMIDLKLCRNLSIMGLSLLLGLIIPLHFEKHPVDTGHFEIDNILNMLLNIKMLVGGLIVTFLDNTVPGATRAQRGFRDHLRIPSESDVSSSESSDHSFEVLTSSDAYTFPEVFQRLLRAVPLLQSLPILPKLTKSQYKTNRV
uniref:Sulfate_transp domain-containing protein n=1 Tax=Caenorhabditis tropicalis TaxID=1561998 RepID=A0A1I7SZK2_9PELO